MPGQTAGLLQAAAPEPVDRAIGSSHRRPRQHPAGPKAGPNNLIEKRSPQKMKAASRASRGCEGTMTSETHTVDEVILRCR